MNRLKTERLTIVETSSPWTEGPFRGMRCVIASAWQTADQFPTLLVGTVFLVEVRSGSWILSHILIEDEARRKGFATELLRFYEDRLGKVDGCFASEAGAAFANRYIERFGPRANWRIFPPSAVEAYRQQENDPRNAIERDTFNP